MSNTMELRLDTGAIDVPVYIDDESVGTIRFRPTDIDIVKRYEEMMNWIEKKDISGETSDEEVLIFTDELKEKFDELFGYKVSDVLFSKCNPTTVVSNGDFIFECILDGIAPIIENVFNERLKKKEARIKKATAGYKKGKSEFHN